jgi:hypothetical protein
MTAFPSVFESVMSLYDASDFGLLGFGQWLLDTHPGFAAATLLPRSSCDCVSLDYYRSTVAAM